MPHRANTNNDSTVIDDISRNKRASNFELAFRTIMYHSVDSVWIGFVAMRARDRRLWDVLDQKNFYNGTKLAYWTWILLKPR